MTIILYHVLQLKANANPPEENAFVPAWGGTVATTNPATDVTSMSRVRHMSCLTTDLAPQDLCGTTKSNDATGIHQLASAYVRELVSSNNKTKQTHVLLIAWPLQVNYN